MPKKAATKKVVKKRIRKNVEHGQAHIQASFNNTIVTLTDAEMLFHGQVPAVLDLRVQGNLLLTLLRWQLKQQQRQLFRTV